MTDNRYLYPYFLKNSPETTKTPNQRIETSKKQQEPKKKEGGSQNEHAGKQ